MLIVNYLVCYVSRFSDDFDVAVKSLVWLVIRDSRSLKMKLSKRKTVG